MEEKTQKNKVKYTIDPQKGCLKKVDGFLFAFAPIVAFRDIQNVNGVIKEGTYGAYVLIDEAVHLSQDDESWADENTILHQGSFVAGDDCFVKNSYISGCVVRNSTVEDSFIDSRVDKFENIPSSICSSTVKKSKVRSGKIFLKNAYMINSTAIVDANCSVSIDGTEISSGVEDCSLNVYEVPVRGDTKKFPSRKNQKGETKKALTIVGEYTSSLIEGSGTTLNATLTENPKSKSKTVRGVEISPITNTDMRKK